jgi:hypothetical protein
MKRDPGCNLCGQAYLELTYIINVKLVYSIEANPRACMQCRLQLGPGQQIIALMTGIF